MLEYQKAVAEIERLRADLLDPAKVWVNMLRGTIARPQALEHYEECKAEIEQLQRAYRPADMLEYQKAVAEIERLRAQVEPAKEFRRVAKKYGFNTANDMVDEILRLRAVVDAAKDFLKYNCALSEDDLRTALAALAHRTEHRDGHFSARSNG